MHLSRISGRWARYRVRIVCVMRSVYLVRRRRHELTRRRRCNQVDWSSLLHLWRCSLLVCGIRRAGMHPIARLRLRHGRRIHIKRLSSIFRSITVWVNRRMMRRVWWRWTPISIIRRRSTSTIRTSVEVDVYVGDAFTRMVVVLVAR
jgi:hypothetical protein